MTPEDLVRILKDLPERELALIPLTRRLMGEDGKLSAKLVVFHGEEVLLAVEEVRENREQVEAFWRALSKCE